MKIRKTTFKLNILSAKMNIFSFLIVCAAVVGYQAIKDEPKINFGMCFKEFSKFDASGILSYFNDPENADLKELLQYLREIINKHEYDEKITQLAVERIFGKSEMNYLITEMVMNRRELNKQKSLCMINKILGENETGSFDVNYKGFKELIMKLRVRVKNLKFDKEKSQAFIEFVFGKSEMITQFSELLMTGLEMIKPYLLNICNLILGDKNQGSFLQDVDFKKTLRNLRSIIQNYKIDVDEIREYFEEDLELGENEWTEVLPELIKVRADMDKHYLIDHINEYLGDKETNWDSAYQQAEYEKLLRKLRDMLHNFIFDEVRIRVAVKIALQLKSGEVTNHIARMIMITLEMFKQNISDFINRYLGDIETPGAFSQTVDTQKLKSLRYRILIADFDEGMYFHELIGRSVQQSEMVDPVYNLLKTSAAKGRQRLLDFIDKILKDREAQGTSSKQEADPKAFRLKKRLEKLISRMKYNLASREGLRENKLLMKKAIAGYEKLLTLGLDLNGKFKRIFEDLLKFDRSSSSKF